MKAGVAISPDTPSTAISDELGHAADMLLVMTVYPGPITPLTSLHLLTYQLGRGGQKFLDRCVPKVAELRARFPDKDIEVDGGVGPATVHACADAGELSPVALAPTPTPFSGSNVIVAGTAIFAAQEPDKVIATLKAVVNAALAKRST